MILQYLTEILLTGLCISNCCGFFKSYYDIYELRYAKFDDRDRELLKYDARRMFEFAYDNYMRYAFPMDELDPIHCTGTFTYLCGKLYIMSLRKAHSFEGRGPDRRHPENININDVLGDYCLGLVDSLTTLVVLGNRSEFFSAVRNVIANVNFDKDSTVQVFEATIRYALAQVVCRV